MTDLDPRNAMYDGVKVKAENVISKKEEGYFEYSWSANNPRKHFKRIRKRVRFQNKLKEVPDSIQISNLFLNNCSNLVILSITNSGFTVQVTGIRASENTISFNWETVKNEILHTNNA